MLVVMKSTRMLFRCCKMYMGIHAHAAAEHFPYLMTQGCEVGHATCRMPEVLAWALQQHNTQLLHKDTTWMLVFSMLISRTCVVPVCSTASWLT